MPSQPPQKDLQKLNDILQMFLKKRKIPIDVNDYDLWETWCKAVGPLISAQTYPYKIKNNTLFVKVTTSIWMQQLQFMKQEIIDKAAFALKKEKIKNIYFSIGKIPANLCRKPEERVIIPDQYELKEWDKKFIEDSLTFLSDEELKDIVKRVMTKEIITRRMKQEQESP